MFKKNCPPSNWKQQNNKTIVQFHIKLNTTVFAFSIKGIKEFMLSRELYRQAYNNLVSRSLYVSVDKRVFSGVSEFFLANVYNSR